MINVSTEKMNQYGSMMFDLIKAARENEGVLQTKGDISVFCSRNEDEDCVSSIFIKGKPFMYQVCDEAVEIKLPFDFSKEDKVKAKVLAWMAEAYDCIFEGYDTVEDTEEWLQSLEDAGYNFVHKLRSIE